MKLNKEQEIAAYHKDGPLLILAGAGSGKTRVMTERTGILIDHHNILPHNILAITFTNKAATELKERIMNKVNPEVAKDITVKTFHSLCVAILRKEIYHIKAERDVNNYVIPNSGPYNGNFTIYDANDSKKLYKECIRELMLDEKEHTAMLYGPKIASLRDELVSAEDAEKIVAWIRTEENNRPERPDIPSYVNFQEVLNIFNKNISTKRWDILVTIYQRYQRKLERSNSVDFDNLIYLTVKLFFENPDVLGFYHEYFKYIMVDEYQDTSHAQFALCYLLSLKYRNIAVVGDDYQSIYGFRGADIKNILDFEKTYKDACVVKLEQNYRSTKPIIKLANLLISKNEYQKKKELRTDKEGDPVEYRVFQNERQEIDFVVKEIKNKVRNKGFKYSDFAILYRVNAQSRDFEESFVMNSIPYNIVGAYSFYDRTEIKDIISYLKFVANPDDSLSLSRIINAPKRGIGNTSINKALNFAAENEISLFESLKRSEEFLASSSAKKIIDFVELATSLIESKEKYQVGELVEVILDDSQYRYSLEVQDTDTARDRLENLQEFLHMAWNYQQDNKFADLNGFLERIALVKDQNSDEEENDNKVTLMTIHSSKGLEFPAVFLIAFEENIMPFDRAVSEGTVEEERRLGYVAITRAQSQLYITRTLERKLFNKYQRNKPSRFLIEMDLETDYSKNGIPDFDFGF